jgi:hypothetical protein
MSARIALCGAIVLFAGCDTSSLVGPEGGTFETSANVTLSNGGSTPLLAGQTTEVGLVRVDAIADGFKVTYEITLAGACITEWHLAVGATLNHIPRNRPGNPMIGLFPYSGEEPCVTEVDQDILFDDVPGYSGSGDIVVAAHAVVSIGVGGVGENSVYGIDRTTRDIYKLGLDVDGNYLGSSMAFATDVAEPWTENWPNGLALDRENGRLYFTNTEIGAGGPNGQPVGPSPLYFIDVETGAQTEAGALIWRNASGVFAGGAYWYVPQNQGDNLYKVTFKADGTVDEETPACPTFVSGASTPMFYGDLAFRDGLIYGSARITNNTGNATFFTLDPATCAYTPIGSTAPLLQLAFDCQGNLIGHDTANGNQYVVDPSNAALTAAGNSANRYNDLSEGLCPAGETREETAWGAGYRFVNRGNWATYFKYSP